MGLSIRNSSTRSNLSRLRDHVSRAQAGGEGKISILIDCATGEINIPQPISAIEQRIQSKKSRLDAHSFKHAELGIQIGQEGISFNLKESDPKLHLEKQAKRVMEETMQILNKVGKWAHTLQEALQGCMRTAMNDLPEEIQRHSGWAGSIDRVQAEQILGGHPIGTYVLREGDAETASIEENLSKHNAAALRCFVLTLVERDRKISDKLLIQEKEGWALYNDDPQMTHYQYRPLQNVLREAGAGHPMSMPR